MVSSAHSSVWYKTIDRDTRAMSVYYHYSIRGYLTEFVDRFIVIKLLN